MATQSTKDEEVYKREYQRIKSLVSSAYVRQTSVSQSLQVYFMKNCLNVCITFQRRPTANMCFNYFIIYSVVLLTFAFFQAHFKTIITFD